MNKQFNLNGHELYTNTNSNFEIVTALVANIKGEIFDLQGYGLAGTMGTVLEPVNVCNTIKIPKDSELMFLPERKPILYNIKKSKLEVVAKNPYNLEETIHPVAVFNSPGYLVSHTCSYLEMDNAKILPLFSYGAIGWHNNNFRSTAILVDNEPRQDLKKMPIKKVIKGIKKIKKIFPNNNMISHIEKCALIYGCPAGKNFFLGRYEAPLPISKSCNAKCLGCISLQNKCDIKSSQNRIAFSPSSMEIAELALFHIQRTKNAIVSFGQGCEGDPLLASNTIISAIKIIRNKTSDGTINLNTNGSLPKKLEQIFDAGLDSIRISLNSFREPCYNAYFRPQNYTFNDVLNSVNIAISKRKHIAINYLSCPGFTDSIEEVKNLKTFLQAFKINMIQWRNLNYDPMRYFNIMNKVSKSSSPIGMNNLINKITYKFPSINHGYFNPSKKF